MLSGQPAYDREGGSKAIADDIKSLLPQALVAERAEMIG